jgi:hypothetical protein
MRDTAALAGRQLLQGQTNFVKSLWKFNSVYDAQRLFDDHKQTPRYEVPLRAAPSEPRREDLYVHATTEGKATRRQ